MKPRTDRDKLVMAVAQRDDFIRRLCRNLLPSREDLIEGKIQQANAELAAIGVFNSKEAALDNVWASDETLVYHVREVLK